MKPKTPNAYSQQTLMQRYFATRVLDSKKRDRYRAYILRDDVDKLLEAKKLHAHVYLKRHFIGMKDVSAEGIMTDAADPHQYLSQYFVVCDTTVNPEKVVVTARQISTPNGETAISVPLIEQAHIYPSKLEQILTYDSSECVEISGLAKHIDHPTLPVLMVYRLLWQYSLRQNHKLWLMALDPALYRRLHYFFGDTIERIGEDTPYTGADVVPAMLRIDDAVLRMEQQAATFNPVRKGIYRAMLEFFAEEDPEIELSV